MPQGRLNGRYVGDWGYASSGNSVAAFLKVRLPSSLALTRDNTASSIGVITPRRCALITRSHNGSNFFQPAE